MFGSTFPKGGIGGIFGSTFPKGGIGGMFAPTFSKGWFGYTFPKGGRISIFLGLEGVVVLSPRGVSISIFFPPFVNLWERWSQIGGHISIFFRGSYREGLAPPFPKVE